MKKSSPKILRGCPRKNGLKANFVPAPISLSFSLEVNNVIPCSNITFTLINFILFIFYETILKVTPKLLNLSSVTPIIKL